MRPFSRRSFNYSFNPFNPDGAILYEGIEIAWVSGRISMSKSISLSGGILGISYEKTFDNTFKTKTNRIGDASTLDSLT